MKRVTAAELGGAAYDSNGEIEQCSNGVWTAVALHSTPESQLHVSLHTSEAGARARLSQIGGNGEVNWCEIETP